MKVSLITISFNSIETIQETIDTVKSQSILGDIEYIVIDGNSTDGTKELLANESCITKFISEKDYGIYDAMNKGLRIATGDIVGFINSDDLLLESNVIENIVQAFRDYNADVVYANLFYVKREDPSIIVRKWKSKKYFNRFFEFGHVPPHPTFYIKIDLLDKVGLFNTRFKLAADYEFMFRTLKIQNLRAHYLDKYTVKMRLGGATNLSLGNIFKQNIEIMKAWEVNGLESPFYFLPIRILHKILQFF